VGEGTERKQQEEMSLRIARRFLVLGKIQLYTDGSPYD